MSFNLRPGTSLFGNITFTPGTNENYVAPPIHGTISTSSTSLTYYAVSSDASDDNATNEGSVFIFNSSDGSLVKELNVAGIDLQRTQDRFGFELESYGTKIFIRSWGDDEAGGNVGAVFVFDADDLDADPVKLIPSPVVDPVNANTQFGTSIVASDDKLFIGDSGSSDNYAGIVYVYDLSDLTAEPTTLTIGGDKDAFGKSLAISSGKLFVGASVANTVYVYDLSDLTASPQSFTDPTLSNFGFELASNSSTVFVHSRHGAGFISVYDATDLSYITKLTRSDGNYFGWDISATEDYLCTGSLFMNKAFVYDLSDLTASPVELAVSGSSQLGYSTNAKDNTFIVGANEAAYVYDLTDLNAAPLVLINDDGATGEFFGKYTALVYATSAPAPEPASEQVSLVELYLNATDSGVVDSSSNSHQLTAHSSISVVNDSPYNNETSMGFNGNYLTTTDGVDFSDNDFTIELWWYPTSTGRQGLFHGSAGADWSIGIDYNSTYNNPTLGFWASSNGSTWDLVNSDPGGNGVTTGEPVQNAWNHIAYVRNGSTLTLYLNGVNVGEVTGVTASIHDKTTTHGMSIGTWWKATGWGGGPMSGNVADYRITLDAVYTENFSVPTEPVGDYTVAVESSAPAPSESSTTYLTNAIAQNISGDGAWGVGAVSNIGAWTGTFDASTGKYTKTSTGMWDSFLDSIDLSGADQGDEFWFIVGAENMSTEFGSRGYLWNWARTSSESPKFFPVNDGGTAYIQVRSDTGQFEDNVGNFTPLNINLESGVIGAHTQLLLANRYTKSTGKMDTWYSTENPSIGIENITWTKLYNYDLTPGESLTEIKLGGLVREGTGQVIRLWDASTDNVPVQPSSPSAPEPISASDFTITGLSNNNLYTSANGLSLLAAGGSWSTYRNLPAYLTGLLATGSVNDGNDHSWTIPTCKVYMIRQPDWQPVDLTGWTLIESGTDYINYPHDSRYTNLDVYSKDFTAGTYTFDNFSAMYMFADPE